MNKQDQGANTSMGSTLPCTPHDSKILCSACTPVLWDFVGDGMARKIVDFREFRAKVIPKIAATYGVPARFFEDIVGYLMMQDIVKAWKNRRFVQHEAVCQLCGTLKPHNVVHCRRVRVRMMDRGARATIMARKALLPLLESMQKVWPDVIGFTNIIAEMKAFMLDDPPHIRYKRRKESN